MEGGEWVGEKRIKALLNTTPSSSHLWIRIFPFPIRSGNNFILNGCRYFEKIYKRHKRRRKIEGERRVLGCRSADERWLCPPQFHIWRRFSRRFELKKNFISGGKQQNPAMRNQICLGSMPATPPAPAAVQQRQNNNERQRGNIISWCNIIFKYDYGIAHVCAVSCHIPYRHIISIYLIFGNGANDVMSTILIRLEVEKRSKYTQTDVKYRIPAVLFCTVIILYPSALACESLRGGSVILIFYF